MGKIVYTTEVPGILALFYAILELIWVLICGIFVILCYVLKFLKFLVVEIFIPLGKYLWYKIMNMRHNTYGELFYDDPNVIENKRELY